MAGRTEGLLASCDDTCKSSRGNTLSTPDGNLDLEGDSILSSTLRDSGHLIQTCHLSLLTPASSISAKISHFVEAASLEALATPLSPPTVNLTYLSKSAAISFRTSS
jgi:hypothetical protein